MTNEAHYENLHKLSKVYEDDLPKLLEICEHCTSDYIILAKLAKMIIDKIQEKTSGKLEEVCMNIINS